LATIKELELIHSKIYIEKIKLFCENGGGYIDSDTILSDKTFLVACQSAGAWLDGVDEVINYNSAFILSRPPGHHAKKEGSMGFCIFSNAALAAFYAIKKYNLKKIVIFDWDVHHGNGTQSIVESNPNISYASIHQFPFYPGTGLQTEQGYYKNVLNIPISAGLDSSNYLKLFDKYIIPFIKKNSPDLLIISAGFDAHKNDPLASINLIADDYAYMTSKCLNINSKILLGLEGGYNLKALAECCVSVLNELI
tara:strand:+ start:322 stop:1077 length:756 start_codon:yes stop_codon:yes gene_type:complete